MCKTYPLIALLTEISDSLHLGIQLGAELTHSFEEIQLSKGNLVVSADMSNSVKG